MGRNVFRIEVQNCGTASQLRLNKHYPLMSLNKIRNRLGDFSCGRVAGRGLRLLRLIAAGSAMITSFSCLQCQFGGVGCGDGGRPVSWAVGGVFQSIGSIGFVHISFTFDNLFLRLSFIFIVSS